MKLADRFSRMIDGMPEDGSITLPVKTIVGWLDANGTGLERDLTVQEVGEFFGRSPQTICRWIRQGRLDAYTFQGTEYRITESAVEEFQERERSSGAVTEQ